MIRAILLQGIRLSLVRKAIVGFLCFGCSVVPDCVDNRLGGWAFGQDTKVPAGLSIELAILKTVEVTSISSQVSGVLKSVPAREGDRVAVGATLASILSTATELQLERASVSVEVARKNFENGIDTELARKSFAVADNEYVRAIEANKRVENVYPVIEVDRLRLVRDRASLEIDRSLHAKDLAQLELNKNQIEHRQLAELLDKHTIRAPVSGMVVAIEKRMGEWVEPGTVVLRLVEIDRLRIEGFLPAEQADPKLVGTEAQVEVQVSGKTTRTTAKLVFISPEVNPINAQVRVYLDVDNSEGRLRPGLRPRVWIPGQTAQTSALQVPSLQVPTNQIQPEKP